MTCPDCGKETEEDEACEHCGCPLTEEAVTDLAEGLLGLFEEIRKENQP